MSSGHSCDFNLTSCQISEVKNYLSEHKKQYEEQLKRYKANNTDEYNPGTAFLFGAQKPVSHAEILSHFPPKSTADLLVARYFNTYDPGIHIIHGPTFQKQYDMHWANPTETPVVWLGLCFAMMCIALQSYSRGGDEPPEYRGKSWAMSSEYRTLTAQCLVKADITTPITNMLETLILHVYADYARSRDAEAGILLSTGIIVRLAMRMGLHRDSAPYQGISVFQGEMRRRIWAAIRCLDVLFSAQAGMPPIARPQDTNTEIPRNLWDDELFEDMQVLPPSRPETENTPTLYLINRTRLVYVLGDAVELTQTACVCPSYEDVMKLDEKARELHDSISPHLKLRSMDESARDPSTLIMQRFTLELLFLKTICVLHKKFLAVSRRNARFAHSRRVCIDASMTMLQHQATLHRECQPGGRLRNVKWFISSLTTVDFLLAAMIICSDLYHTARAERQGLPPSDVCLWSHDRRDEMLAALETALSIWETLKDRSMEAYKAHATLQVMVNALKEHQITRKTQSFSTGSTFSSTSPMEDPNVAPEHSAAMTLGMLSTGGMTPNSANMFDTRYPASIGNLLNDPMPAQPGVNAQFGGVAVNPTTGPEGAASPFSSLFGANIGVNMELPATNNIDWVRNHRSATRIDANTVTGSVGFVHPRPRCGNGHKPVLSHGHHLYGTASWGTPNRESYAAKWAECQHVCWEWGVVYGGELTVWLYVVVDDR